MAVGVIFFTQVYIRIEAENFFLFLLSEHLPSKFIITSQKLIL